jgi:uncharacterized protein YdaU (DUF1376 family)
MDWYPFYYNIFQADTLHLDPYQDGCYRRLIDHYMRTRQPLPDNDIALARIIGISLDDWKKMARAIVVPFFRHNDGKLYHSFCDKMLDEQDAISRKKSLSGQIGAKKRWSQPIENKEQNSTCHADAIAHPMANDSTGQDKTGQDKTGNDINIYMPPIGDIDPAFDLYNFLAYDLGLSVVQVRTEKRKKALRERLKECGGIDGWGACMEKVRSSRFLTGDNKTAWKADFDFIVTKSKFIKIMEGAYDNKEKVNNKKQQLKEMHTDGW